MTQLLQEFIADESQNYNVRRQAFTYFGRWTQSMLTLFEMTVAPGAWGKPGRLVIFDVNPLYAVFFIAYVWGISFAVVRIISALFLKTTLTAAADHRENAMAERLKKKDKVVKELKNMFLEADTDGGGHLSLDEFSEYLSNPK